jgi:hypothetical protein
MKLRLQSNSVRLRLKRSEVNQLVKTGLLEESIVFGTDAVFHYVLESCAVPAPRASMKNNTVLIQVPSETVRNWAEGDDVGIETAQPVDGQGELQVLIEKDFACLDRPDEENVDTFPNPLAGTKC